MINRDTIKNLTYRKTYIKGNDIFRIGNIVKYDCWEEEPGITWLEATVREGEHSFYDVQIHLDDEEGKISSYKCNCMSFQEYDGLCKHCVAVLLKYMDDLDAAMGKSRREGQMDIINMLRQMKMEKEGEQTTGVLKDLLSLRNEKAIIVNPSVSLNGKVHLEPFLYRQYRKPYLEFKLGYGKMYVMRNIYQFARAVNQNLFVSYGKNLEFVHTLEAFDEESRPVAEFILGQMEDEAGQSSSGRGRLGNYEIGEIRRLPLYGTVLDEFMDLMEGRMLSGALEGGKEHQWLVKKGEPRPSMVLEKREGGASLTVDRQSWISTSRRYYYFMEDAILIQDKAEVRGVSDFLDAMSSVSGNSCFISQKDLPVFCSRLLPDLRKYYQCQVEDLDLDQYAPPEASYEFYLDAPQKNLITCRITVVYQDGRYSAFDRSEKTEYRDILDEQRHVTAVGRLFNAFDEEEQCWVLADDEDRVYQLLTAGVQQLETMGTVFISDALKKFKIRNVGNVSMGISLSGDLLELTVDVSDISQEALAEILSQYKPRKKYYRLKSGEFVNVKEEEMELLHQVKRDLNLSSSQLSEGLASLPRYRALYLESELQEGSLLADIKKSREFHQLIQEMDTDLDQFVPPHSLESILRHYQVQGFQWIKMLHKNGFGGILADDMGLGKTLQVITFLLSQQEELPEGERGKTLIVTPASLVYNWEDEIQRFAPELSVKTVAGSPELRQEVISNCEDGDILVTSYHLLKRDLDLYDGQNFKYQIIDEAQYIKNHNTQVASAIKDVKAGFKLALTGTPMENRLSELWSIFDFIMPGFLHGYTRFRKDFESPIVQGGDEQVLSSLHKMIGPFILRRLKKDVLKDLPDKIEKNMTAKLEGQQEKLYTAHVKRLKLMLEEKTDQEYMSEKLQILSELTKLRQLCLDPALLYDTYQEGSAKLELCVDLIENAISAGHKILLFSQFTSMLSIIEERLDQEKISYYELTGQTDKQERIRLVREFNQDDTSVFCISLKAGGTGLNLTSADMVIHFDPWWNVAVQNQATDRAHRIGQKHVVNVYQLIAKGTIEEKIVDLQERKKQLADDVLGGEQIGVSSLSRDQLLELLGSEI